MRYILFLALLYSPAWATEPLYSYGECILFKAQGFYEHCIGRGVIQAFEQPYYIVSGVTCLINGEYKEGHKFKVPKDHVEGLCL